MTAGEPAGIGPDLVIQLAQQPLPAELVVFADPDLLHDRADMLGLPLAVESFDATQPAKHNRNDPR